MYLLMYHLKSSNKLYKYIYLTKKKNQCKVGDPISNVLDAGKLYCMVYINERQSNREQGERDMAWFIIRTFYLFKWHGPRQMIIWSK